MGKLLVKTKIVIGDEEWTLGFDLSKEGLGGEDLTPEKFEWCLRCLTPAMLKRLRDRGKLIES